MLKRMSVNMMGRGGCKVIGGVLSGALDDWAEDGSGKTNNALTLIFSDSDNELLFTALLLLPGADEPGWQKSTGIRGSG